MKTFFFRILMVVVLLSLLLIPGNVLAATGGLDVGFNYGPTLGANGPVYAVARQSDGKIIIGGNFTAYNGDAGAPDKLLRLNLNGTLDASFNIGGVGADDDVLAIVVQPDDKIIIGGNFTAYNGDASIPDHILRLNADGSPDVTGFNAAGTGVSGGVTALALQTNGRILLGGGFNAYNGDSQAPDNILRINSNGALDTTFNYGSGVRGASSTVSAVLVQPNGLIMIGGNFNSYRVAGVSTVLRHVTRLAADGTLDPTFIATGTEAVADVRAFARQSDGKILIGGFFTTFNGDANAPDSLLRVNEDGSLDTTYNYSGTGPFASGYHAVDALAIQPDDKLLVGGWFTDYNGNTLAPHHVLRVKLDGTWDDTFNGPAIGLDGEAFALALQPNLALLVGGAFTSYNADASASDEILRLLSLPPGPSVTINQAAAQADPTATSPITFTVVFSAPVIGFGDVPADVTLGGTAGATTALVTEIAPNDGTTYSVAVSGMTVTGTVIASIPAGAAQDGNGTASLASTTSDNTVTYDLPASVTVNQASGQADPTVNSPVNFTVVFSKPVSGFGDAQADVTLSGTAGATSINVTQVAPNDGTSYNVAVSGMSVAGTVIAAVPAGAAVDALGFGNLDSTSSDHTVTYNPAILSLTGSGPATVKPGDQYMYTFSYENDLAVTGAAAHITLPGHTTYVASSVSCVVTAGVADCTLGNLPASGHSTFTLTVQLDKLKKIGAQLVLDTTAYTITATGGKTADGALAVTADTLNPFDDVTLSNIFIDYIQSIWAYGITTGCLATPLDYCPSSPVSRGQMAAFIERGVHGANFDPGTPPLTFTDTGTSIFKYYIEALVADGITHGCGTGTTYCPNDPVTRAQMAVFLLRGKFGGSYAPPPATGLVFTDVPASAFAADFIENLKTLNITSGCTPGMYCPNDAVTREQMAKFIQRTFVLALPTP